MTLLILTVINFSKLQGFIIIYFGKYVSVDTVSPVSVCACVYVFHVLL